MPRDKLIDLLSQHYHAVSNSLVLLQMTNFGLFQTQKICRQQISIGAKEFWFYDRTENIVGKGENAGCHYFLLFIRPSKTGRIMLSPVMGGRAASPILCPEHISKTMLAMVMKLHGWIDLIKAECSAQEP